MNIGSMKIFCDVVHTKSFTKTAQNHYVSQPAVTKQIRLLENDYNAILFNRDERVLTLTEAGEIFYVYAKEILRMNEVLFQEIQHKVNQQNQKLVVGASFTIGEYLLPALISEFKKEEKGIQIDLSIGNTPTILEKLNTNKIDIALVEGVFQIEDYNVFKFAEDRLVPICSYKNKLLKQDNIQLQDIIKEQFIVREKASGMRKIIKNELKRHDIEQEQPFMELGSIQAIKSSVEANLGVSFLPEITIQKELEFGALYQIDLDGLNLSRDYWIVQKESRFNKQVVKKFNYFIKGKKF